MHADRSEYKYFYCKKHIHIISNLTINAGSKELRIVPIDHTTLGKFKIIQVDFAVLL